ncbi:hypothetical protein [Solicola sp. PLA-1-18]|uniref:hypothetical protein n=1 Tax=Solicola sp. PLA-1-18 TaxID=3380532 RepID=UPI003B8048F7
MMQPLTEAVAAQDAAIDLGSWVQVADIAVALLLTGTAALSDVAVGLESIRGVVRVSVQDANADLE